MAVSIGYHITELEVLGFVDSEGIRQWALGGEHEWKGIQGIEGKSPIYVTHYKANEISWHYLRGFRITAKPGSYIYLASSYNNSRALYFRAISDALDRGDAYYSLAVKYFGYWWVEPRDIMLYALLFGKRVKFIQRGNEVKPSNAVAILSNPANSEVGMVFRRACVTIVLPELDSYEVWLEGKIIDKIVDNAWDICAEL